MYLFLLRLSYPPAGGSRYRFSLRLRPKAVD
jgi:hypothetical protein